MITIKCAYCGKDVNKFPSRLKENNYCSYECKKLDQIKPESHIEKICQNCGKTYTVKRFFAEKRKTRYCSRACMDEGFKTTRRGSGNPLWVERVETTCVECGNKFLVRQSDLDRGFKQYCSAKCARGHFSKTYKRENHWNWKHGKDTATVGNGYGRRWKDIANAVRKRDNYTCQKCGKKQFIRKFDVHHKVPLREFEGNLEKANQMSNLITLCTSCHKVEDSKIRHYSSLSPERR